MPAIFSGAIVKRSQRAFASFSRDAFAPATAPLRIAMASLMTAMESDLMKDYDLTVSNSIRRSRVICDLSLYFMIGRLRARDINR